MTDLASTSEQRVRGEVSYHQVSELLVVSHFIIHYLQRSDSYLFPDDLTKGAFAAYERLAPCWLCCNGRHAQSSTLWRQARFIILISHLKGI